MTYIGVSPSNGVRRVHTYTATGSQTTFTGASSEGITLSYTDANFMDVYQNGVLLAPADYTATSGTSVVLAEGAAASDIVTITVYDAFSVADTVSKSAGGTFDGNVAMAGTLGVTGVLTGTSLDISGNIDVDGTLEADAITIDGTAIASVLSPIAGSSSIVTTGALNAGSISSGFGNINIGSSTITTTGAVGTGDLTVTENNSNASTDIAILNSNGVATVGNQAKLHLGTTNSTSHGASIIGEFTGTANTNHATDLIIKTTNTGSSLNEVMRINSSGKVGIGDTSPLGNKVHIRTGGSASSVNATAGLVLEDDDSTRCDLQFIGPDGTFQSILFGDVSDDDIGKISYSHSGNNMRFSVNASERMRIDSSGNVGIGESSPQRALHVNGIAKFMRTVTLGGSTGSNNYIGYFTAESFANNAGESNVSIGTFSTQPLSFATQRTERMRIDNNGKILVNSTNATAGGFAPQMLIKQGTDNGNFRGIDIEGQTADAVLGFFYNSTTNSFKMSSSYRASAGYKPIDFEAGGATRMRLVSTGELLVGGLTSSNSSGESLQVYDNGSPALSVGRQQDGTLVHFRTGSVNGATHGSISISGTTCSYNAFSGSHWSRLSDNSKPTILKGTIIETIDEMCDWYQAEFTVPATGEDDAYVRNEPIGLPSGKSVGDTITYTYEGTDYTATIIKEGDEKHVKCKISDTADSKKVYGVHMAWDADDDTVNDMYVTAVGTHVVRINKDVTVSAGDLLSSNGDGTAKVQDDDIIRSKTIGKVLTNLKQETYSDGSYTVPCALYCG